MRCKHKTARWRCAPTVLLLAGVIPIQTTEALTSQQPETEPPTTVDGDPTKSIQNLIDSKLGETPKAAPVNPALQAILDADYLTEDERRSLRIEHGLWEPGDLNLPTDRANAALIAGGYNDPVFDNLEVNPSLRAQALLMRGEPQSAISVLVGETSLHSIRIRAQALFDLARFDDADATIQEAVDRLTKERIEDSTELAEGVRALMIRARIRGSTRSSGGDFQTLKSIIERGRDELDRLSWRIRLVEAELLFEKHNTEDAAAALNEVLALNPRCAEAIGMLAELSVNGFAFDQAEALVAKLHAIARPFSNGTELASPQAAMIESRMRLRQRDPDAAFETLMLARECWPQHRGLLAWHAAAHAAAFNAEASDQLLGELERESPGSPLGLYTVARVLSEARQYGDAIETFKLASAKLPNWSAPQIELGLVLIQAGRDAEAERVLAKAVDLDPFNARVRNSLELVRGLAQFKTIESDHFVVRFSPGSEVTENGLANTGNDAGFDEFLAQEMLPVLESIHARVSADPQEISGGIGHEPATKTLIEIMPSHAWFSVRITGMTRIHTMAAATGPVIAMESPREGPGFTVGPFDWPRVLQHEYTHTVTLSRTKNRIPHWFTEAAAVFCEDAPRDENTWRLLARAYETHTLFDLDQINTAFVRPKKPSDRGQAYAQGHWMYQYIVDTWGASAPTALMDRYAAGEREASAFEAELGTNTKAFMEGFLNWAAADLRSVGLLVSEDTPTIPEMLEADRREAEDAESIRPNAAFIERWAKQYPEHPQLIELSVSHALNQADGQGPELSDSVIGLLESLTLAVPVAETPHRLLARHYLAGPQSSRSKAIPHLEFLNDREQNAATYAIELATLCAESGQNKRAMLFADRAARISPFDADIREFAARIALTTAFASEASDGSKFDTAARHIEALTIIEPGVQKHRQRFERVQALANP